MYRGGTPGVEGWGGLLKQLCAFMKSCGRRLDDCYLDWSHVHVSRLQKAEYHVGACRPILPARGPFSGGPSRGPVC